MKKMTRNLIILYGIAQFFHTFANLRAAYIFFQTGHVAYPAIESGAGFIPGITQALVSMGLLDTTNAAVSAWWAWAVLRGKEGLHWLGIVVITIFLYSGTLFDLITFSGGGWVGWNLVGYISTNISFIFAIVLLIQWIQLPNKPAAEALEKQ